MRPLIGSGDESLGWLSAGALSREHELRAGEELVGKLRFAGLGRREASAECAEGRWTFRRGLFGRTVSIVDPGRGGEIARYHRGWLGGGTLELPRGQNYRWRRFGFWRLACGFTAENGEPLLTYRRKPFSFGRRGTLTIDADARRLRELPLLALLGWYLVLQIRAHAH